MPLRFSWVVPAQLAALAEPSCLEELQWLRQQGIGVLISMTESPPPRAWINEAGLLLVHVPVPDMTAPTYEQLKQIVVTIRKALAAGLRVAIHCTAGLGRTGTALAAYLVAEGLSPEEAMARVRQLRPQSIETPEQEQAVATFAQLWQHDNG
jgi:atypical dual specificity phosphatase